jgi:hypothetical protein
VDFAARLAGALRAVDFLAVDLRAVDFLAADFLAGDRLAVDFRAVDFFAADFRAVDFFAADFRAVDFFAADFRAVDFFAVDLRAVDFLAADFLAGDRLAVDFRAVDFFAADLRAVDFFAADFLVVVFLMGGTVPPFPCVRYWLRWDLSAELWLNFIAVDAGTLTVAPVCGLRPVRALRRTVENEPKPGHATFSPSFVFAMSTSKNAPSVRSVSALPRPAFDETSSISSALVVISVRTSCAERCFPRTIRQCAHASRKHFFTCACNNSSAAVVACATTLPERPSVR